MEFKCRCDALQPGAGCDHPIRHARAMIINSRFSLCHPRYFLGWVNPGCGQMCTIDLFAPNPLPQTVP